MRLPGLEEGLLGAGMVLKKERSEMLRWVRVERLHQALMAPAAHASGSPIYRTRGEIARNLLVECARGKILPTPEHDFDLGWLMTQRAIELSDCRWRPGKGHQARSERFRGELLEGADPGTELALWLEEGIKPPHPPRPDERELSLQVTSPMHPPPEHDMGKWATAVDSGLKRFLEERGPAELVGTNRPQIYPLTPSRAGTHRKIEERVHMADGLVVLSPQSSWGAAIELVAGLRIHLPTLFIHPADSAPSEWVRSHLHEMGATSLAIDDKLESEAMPKAIEELVYRWLQTAFARILGTPRRRESMETRCSPLLAAIRDKRARMSESEERRALAAAGLPPQRARALVEEPWAILSASTTETISLANAYGVSANVDVIVEEPAPERPPYLTPREQRALGQFVTERGLSTSEAIQLSAAGQREITAPGHRRKLFTDPSKWEETWKTLGPESR